MPIYMFQNPNSGETIELVQKMKDEHIYIDENGLQWNRVFSVPNAAIDTVLNADTSAADWMRKTQNKNWTLGDAWDTSAELSRQREKKMGKDPLKEKNLKDYSKKRNGMKHDSIKQSTKHWDVS